MLTLQNVKFRGASPSCIYLVPSSQHIHCALQLAKRYVNAHALVDLSVSVVLEPLGSNSESASQQKVEDACIVVSTPMVIEKGVTAVLLHLLSKNIVICQWVHLINHRVFQKIDSADDLSGHFSKLHPGMAIKFNTVASKLCTLLRPGLR